MVGDDKLKKEVISLFSQGLSHTEVKNKLLEQGRSIDEVNKAMNETFSYHAQQQKPQSKIWLILSIGLAIVLVFLIINMITQKNQPFEETISYSEYAPEWIEETIPTTDNKTLSIDVIQATEGRGDFIGDQQRFFENDGTLNSLFFSGSYNGVIIQNTYTDNKGDVKMSIYSDMNPNDGIIEGFAVYKKEEDLPVIYLFVDEDWKKQSNNNINIIWGNDIINKSSLNEKPFSFALQRNGIYIDKITTDIFWIENQNPVVGRIFFGEITLQNIKDSDYNKTFIALT